MAPKADRVRSQGRPWPSGTSRNRCIFLDRCQCRLARESSRAGEGSVSFLRDSKGNTSCNRYTGHHELSSSNLLSVKFLCLWKHRLQGILFGLSDVIPHHPFAEVRVSQSQGQHDLSVAIDSSPGPVQIMERILSIPHDVSSHVCDHAVKSGFTADQIVE